MNKEVQKGTQSMAEGMGPYKKYWQVRQSHAAVWHFARKLGERGDTFNAVQQAFSLGWDAHDENENTQKENFCNICQLFTCAVLVSVILYTCYITQSAINFFGESSLYSYWLPE